ncbi:hypothetical protein BKA62DRAFT_774689 [Auriculariales sp. MPI-PUGE-AT-0066]|nr:hypothetical protein BKA62DRAFT_774689 [Auriculariales sp. MPI-PUGE-AT-0066]
MARIAAAFTVVAALASSVLAAPSLGKRDHHITITNRCQSRSVTPVYHDVGGTSYNMQTLNPNESTETSVGESQLAWRIWGEDGKGCGWPDGGGCLLLECSFDNADFRQCNLSRVDGFNMGIEFGFDDPGCSGNQCLHGDCGGDQAFSDPTNGGPSLRQCNTPNVGMTVVFSCD